MLAVLSLAIFVVYLIAINSLSVTGFAIADYKTRLDDLKRDNQNLEVKISSLSSYDYLQNKIAGLNLVASNDIKYINPISQTMAKK